MRSHLSGPLIPAGIRKLDGCLMHKAGESIRSVEDVAQSLFKPLTLYLLCARVKPFFAVRWRGWRSGCFRWQLGQGMWLGGWRTQHHRGAERLGRLGQSTFTGGNSAWASRSSRGQLWFAFHCLIAHMDRYVEQVLQRRHSVLHSLLRGLFGFHTYLTGFHFTVASVCV